MLPVHGEGTPLPVKRPAARVGTAARLGDGPSRHTRVVFRLAEAGPAAVPAWNTTLVTVITARAVTVLPWLRRAVSVPWTRSGHFLLPCGWCFGGCGY